MFFHGLKWFEIESNIVFAGNYIDRGSCLLVILGIILSSVRIILNSASLYYGSVKEPWTEMMEGEKLLFELQVWDLVCHCFLWGLTASVSSQIMMEQHRLLFWGYSSSEDYLASNRPVLVCAGKALQKPPTPGVLQACKMNYDCHKTTVRKKYLITLTAAQSGRSVTRIFPLCKYSERPFVTSLLLIVVISKVPVLLYFAFSF